MVYRRLKKCSKKTVGFELRDHLRRKAIFSIDTAARTEKSPSGPLL
ncbi:hypothetical protein CLOSTMETH_03533 [[Clostridium] methylpentosum DSM 5476]|uniref:Uncharacterized protein n=1 Tax=[Clostridium] methylpentosum DSM 5476 TaxID=537013 RepID=C0EI38_9FIRM|nr:hypothetical protein CLOSTMETH_03533 [[Clostridium] methylpentosum DSM 5476]